MPFTKVGKDDYTSPSGRHFNGAQVRLYHANGESFPSHQEGGIVNKGYQGKTESFAQGGLVTGRGKSFAKEPNRSEQSRFMKVPDEFRDPDEGDASADEDQCYGKSGEGAGKGFIKPPAAKDKSLPPVKPRK